VKGAPLSLRQVVQWHRPTLTGWPLVSIRIEAQAQLAVRVSGIAVLLAVYALFLPLKGAVIMASFSSDGAWPCLVAWWRN
jgi:hypothetical protein